MSAPIRWKIIPAGAVLLLSLTSAPRFADPGAIPPEVTPARVEIRDIKGPLPPTQLFPWLLPLGSAVSLAAGMTFFSIMRRRRSRSSLHPDPTPLPPEAALDTLAVRFAEGKEELRHLYGELSSLVRLTLEQQSGLPARRMTSQELVKEIVARGAVSNEAAERLTTFLLRCDLVKFAGVTPTAVEIEEALAAARRIILVTTGVTLS